MRLLEGNRPLYDVLNDLVNVTDPEQKLAAVLVVEWLNLYLELAETCTYCVTLSVDFNEDVELTIPRGFYTPPTFEPKDPLDKYILEFNVNGKMRRDGVQELVVRTQALEEIAHKYYPVTVTTTLSPGTGYRTDVDALFKPGGRVPVSRWLALLVMPLFRVDELTRDKLATICSIQIEPRTDLERALFALCRNLLRYYSNVLSGRQAGFGGSPRKETNDQVLLPTRLPRGAL